MLPVRLRAVLVTGSCIACKQPAQAVCLVLLNPNAVAQSQQLSSLVPGSGVAKEEPAQIPGAQTRPEGAINGAGALAGEGELMALGLIGRSTVNDLPVDSAI